MADPTPLEPAPAALGHPRLFLKREDTHELGAFKWRGALPTLERYKAKGATTVVTASTGNHGAATAWAAQRLGLRAVVYAPEGSSRAKLDRIEALGGDVRIVGADVDDAKDEARAMADREGFPFFEDGAEREQYDGYGTIAQELAEQLDEPPAAVVVPVGKRRARRRASGSRRCASGPAARSSRWRRARRPSWPTAGRRATWSRRTAAPRSPTAWPCGSRFRSP